MQTIPRMGRFTLKDNNRSGISCYLMARELDSPVFSFSGNNPPALSVINNTITTANIRLKQFANIELCHSTEIAYEYVLDNQINRNMQSLSEVAFNTNSRSCTCS